MGTVRIFNKVIKRILITFAILLYLCCAFFTFIVLRATGVINIKTETDYLIFQEWWWNKDNNGEGIIDLAEVMPFDWDYMISYNVDCDVETLRKESGIDKSSPRLLGDKGLAFIKNHKVVFSEVWYEEYDILNNIREFPKGIVYFIDGCFCLKKEDAKFKASKDDDGDLWLEKIER